MAFDQARGFIGDAAWQIGLVGGGAAGVHDLAQIALAGGAGEVEEN